MKKIYLNTLTPEEIIKRLKNGGVIKVRRCCEIEYKIVNGFLCRLNAGKLTSISSELFIDDEDMEYYFEEPEEFKVEKTGKYKTRDGRIAYVSLLYDSGSDYKARGIIEGRDTSSSWTLDGLYCIGGETECDLVEYIGD